MKVIGSETQPPRECTALSETETLAYNTFLKEQSSSFLQGKHAMKFSDEDEMVSHVVNVWKTMSQQDKNIYLNKSSV